MEVHLCWYKYDLKLKTLILTQNIFHASEHRRPSCTSCKVSNHVHIEFKGHYSDLNEVKILHGGNLAGLSHQGGKST